MKEFIEKLIGRLEELKSSVMLNNKCCKHIIDKIIEIANKLAEEYKCCDLCYLGGPCEYQNAEARLSASELADDNGWIPCSERLPENISTILVQVKEFESPTIGWYGNMVGWRLSEKDLDELNDFTVIAWQPLPAPYQPKGE